MRFQAPTDVLTVWLTPVRVAVNAVPGQPDCLVLLKLAVPVALVEPTEKLRRLEADGDFTGRLALLEEIRTLPFGPVWDYYCIKQDVPPGPAWLAKVKTYERDVLARRG